MADLDRFARKRSVLYLRETDLWKSLQSWLYKLYSPPFHYNLLVSLSYRLKKREHGSFSH